MCVVMMGGVWSNRYLLKFCRCFTDMSDKGVCPGVMPTGMMESEDAQFIDINAKNTACATPLELAASQGHTEVVRYANMSVL